MPYIVYILRTSKNTLYTGITNDLPNRLKVHNSKKNNASKYLKSFSSFRLVYKEEVADKSEALKREYAIKQLTKQEKEHLVAKD